MAARAGDAAFLSTSTPTHDQLNSRDQIRGWTPLHYAARHNRIDMIHKLLESGSDPMAKDKEGRTASDLAFFWASLQAWELLKSKMPANSFTTEDSGVFGTAEKVNVFGGSPLKRWGRATAKGRAKRGRVVERWKPISPRRSACSGCRKSGRTLTNTSRKS